MQWDYVFEWINGALAKLWIRSYRCFQREAFDSEWKVVDTLSFDVPMWDNMVIGIAHEIGNRVYATA